MANQALGAGGEPPGLLASAAGVGRIGNVELHGRAGDRDQVGVGLGGVPAVRKPAPFPLLANEQPGLDALAGRLAGVVGQVETERLHQDRAVGEGPRSARVELGLLHDPFQARQRGEPLHGRPVGPLRSRDLERQCGGMRLVIGHRGEEARFAQLGREGLGRPIGLGRRLESIEAAVMVDDVQLAGVIGAEAGDVERRIHQLAMPDDLLCRHA